MRPPPLSPRAARAFFPAPSQALAAAVAVSLAASLFLVAGCEAAATSEAPVPAATEFPDTLALLELHLATGVLDSVMAAEGERLGLVCATGEAGCHRAHDPDRVVPLDIVREHPEARAPATGILAAHVRVSDAGWLAADLVFVPMPTAHPSSPLHLKSLGDWGYGVHFAVRHWAAVTRADGETRHWVRLPGTGSVEGGWLALERGGLRGWITPPEEPVWALAHLDPAEIGAAFHHFRILGIAEGWVTMREEVPSDMPCGVDPPPDPPDPATTRVRISGLFTATGMPRIEPAYPRGC